MNTDFESLFEQHKYALAQIEKLSPQALTILSDYQHWPGFKINNYSATGSKISSEWLKEFADSYSYSKNIINPEIIERIAHSISELINSRFIEAHLSGEEYSANCRVTRIGKVLLPYLV